MSARHESYIHREAGESSLRCTCGRWRGKHLADIDGHTEHVAQSAGAAS